MDDLRHSFPPISFTPEEKEHLAARLKAAAEQEETMNNTRRHTIRHVSRRIAIGAGVAAALTTGALAAAMNVGLLNYFDARSPEDRNALEESIYQINRSETYNGWTVELTDCIGDDTNGYVWVEVTAPEGTVLQPPEGGQFCSMYYLDSPEDHFGRNITALPDSDPQDNCISFCLELNSLDGNLRGQTVDFTLEPIVDVWWTDSGTEYAAQHNGSELTEAIRDHTWVFEDVVLDYPDQAVRLTPNLEVPYMDGTATLTKIEITPLTTTVRIEGGSCYDHHGRAAAQQSDGSGDIVIDAGSAGSVTITDNPQEDISTWFECWDALETTLVMKDGTILEPPAISGGTSCQDGVSNDTYKGVPYVEEKSQYAENSNLIPPRVIDPSQVDYILVCGVRIDMPQ